MAWKTCVRAARMIESQACATADPVRMLRVVRFAAKLNFD